LPGLGLGERWRKTASCCGPPCVLVWGQGVKDAFWGRQPS